MGCNSVYTKGYPNVFYDNEPKKILEGKALCAEVLEPLLAYSRFSISYGYISHYLSQQIVKYQDPNKPSYHRWDAGAACDVALHDRVHDDEPPVFGAFWMDENLPVSRVISYSESPFICVGVRREEILSGDHRRALYENRYVGERKPKYISYSDNADTRLRQKQSVALDHPWQGAGYPTYHGGGTKQTQHTRLSKYTMLSDFLYSGPAVENGAVNITSKEYDSLHSEFEQAGQFYDALLERTGALRMSIVRGYESPSWAQGAHTWADGVSLILIPPASVDPQYVVDCALSIDTVAAARITRGRRVGIRLEAM